MIILGVRIDNFSPAEIIKKIDEFLQSGVGHLIITPNPEMLVSAENDWFFKQALNQAELAAADGAGLEWAARHLYGEKLTRWPGVDLMEKICARAAAQNKTIYLVGAQKGIAERAATALRRKYPDLKVAGAERGLAIQDGGSRFGLQFDAVENERLRQRIQTAQPDILFVAFGHGKQEKWLAEFLPTLPAVKIGMGVGGAFDYLAGKVKRAPLFWREAGWEWLWRFLRQPWRIKRIWRAVITFSFLIRDYKKQLAIPFRQGVIGYIVNQEGKFFIGKRRQNILDYYLRGLEHWQPPQGGLNRDETPEAAVQREVLEETGLRTEIVCRCRTVHQYNWSVKFLRHRAYRHRGQQMTIFLLKYNGRETEVKLDQKEFSDFRWVDLAELKRLLHPFRRRSLEILSDECYEKIFR